MELSKKASTNRVLHGLDFAHSLETYTEYLNRKNLVRHRVQAHQYQSEYQYLSASENVIFNGFKI